MAVAGTVGVLGELALYQRCRALVEARGDAVSVDARVTPHTSVSKPCLRVSPHTAPQLLNPCHGYAAFGQ